VSEPRSENGGTSEGDSVAATLPLIRWAGDGATYHMVNFTDEAAEALSMHATLHRLEFGRQRGFGSVKVMARIGETTWKTSVFPQNIDGDAKKGKHWMLLVSKKVMRAEDLAPGEPVSVEVSPL